jgi:hypothetical protein
MGVALVEGLIRGLRPPKVLWLMLPVGTPGQSLQGQGILRPWRHKWWHIYSIQEKDCWINALKQPAPIRSAGCRVRGFLPVHG